MSMEKGIAPQRIAWLLIAITISEQLSNSNDKGLPFSYSVFYGKY